MIEEHDNNENENGNDDDHDDDEDDDSDFDDDDLFAFDDVSFSVKEMNVLKPSVQMINAIGVLFNVLITNSSKNLSNKGEKKYLFIILKFF